MTDSLGDALPKEIERVQEIIKFYEDPEIFGGQLTAELMKADIRLAHKAMMAGDVVMMLTVYQSLKEWEL